MTSSRQSFTKAFTRPHSVCSRPPNTADEMGNLTRRDLYLTDTPRPTKGKYHVNCGSRNYSRINTPSIQDIEREKYSFKTVQIRPTSAPHRAVPRCRRYAPKSAKARTGVGRWDVDFNKENNEDMFGLVKAAKEAKEFTEESEYNRSINQSRQAQEAEEKKDIAPVFNKRLFASQGAVIITREARRLMTVNASANERCDLNSALSKSEVQCLRCVVDGLKLVHKSQDFVKDVLSKVVSYETYRAFEYVPTKSWEDNLACYYILNGAVEVTYDLRSTESRNVYQANIIYSHGTGEYLGLVSPEGPTEDLAPPATVYTKEFTQFIRVDRQRFHQLMRKATCQIDQRKRNYTSSHSFLANVSDEVREKILHKLAIQEYPANRSILSQGEISEYLFIVMKGRCQTYREVYIPEADKEVLFYLTSRDPDDFFGEECVLDHEPSECTVVTATATVIMKLHRTALKMVQRDKLSRFIDELRHENPSDENLRDRGYRNSMWNKYKHTQIKGTLKEGGKMQYLSRPQSAMVRERPPDDCDIYSENIRQFMLKGSKFETLRAQSAKDTGNYRHRKQPKRPHTALPGGLVTDVAPTLPAEIVDNEKENVPENCDDKVDGSVPQLQSTLLTLDKAREMELNIAKAMESRESLMKVLDEPDISAQMKQAWKAEGTQDTQNFMKNGVLVMMTSEDIVRKAKALADTYVDKGKHADNEEEDWDTILHAENKQAKMLITANRMRIKDLKRRLAELNKQREREKKRNEPRRAYYFSDDEDEAVEEEKDNNVAGKPDIVTENGTVTNRDDDEKVNGNQDYKECIAEFNNAEDSGCNTTVELESLKHMDDINDIGVTVDSSNSATNRCNYTKHSKALFDEG